MSGLAPVLVRVVGALVLAVLVALPVTVLSAAPAQACRCAPDGAGAQARAADVVVAGTVLEVRGRDRETRPRSGGAQGPQRFGTVTLVVGVDRIYAGRIPDPTIEVTTAVASSACGLGRLPVDERYFFYLTEDARVLRATSCDGSRPADERQAAAITRALGEGRPVATPTAPPTAVQRTRVADEDAPRAAVVAAPGGVLVVLGLVGLLALSRFGSRTGPES